MKQGDVDEDRRVMPTTPQALLAALADAAADQDLEAEAFLPAFLAWTLETKARPS